MTYREAIQSQISQLDKIFYNCEALRDAATLEEKDAWNGTRYRIQKAIDELNRLDNRLTEARSLMPLRGSY
jgi:hypothetical protein